MIKLWWSLTAGWSLDTGVGRDEAGGDLNEDLWLSRMRWRWGGGGSHEWEFERQNERRALRFKAHRTEADWLAEGGQEDDWTQVMRTELILTVEVMVSEIYQCWRVMLQRWTEMLNIQSIKSLTIIEEHCLVLAFFLWACLKTQLKIKIFKMWYMKML